jgi:drug/metabolite transporter (DMT)-like permease
LILLAITALRDPAAFRIGRRELGFLALYGVTGIAMVQWLYFVALQRMPVGIALLFEYTAPLMVALWARFGQHRQVKRRLWYGLAISLAGLGFVAGVWQGGARLDGVGVLAGLAAAVLLCFYYILGARGVAQRDTISLTWWAFGVSALAGLVTTAFRGDAYLPAGVFDRTVHGVPVWALTLYLIVGGSIASYLLVAGALKHLPPTSVGIIGMVEPVIAAGVAWVVLREHLTLTQLVGGGLVLAGVGIAETARTAGPGAPAEIPPT